MVKSVPDHDDHVFVQKAGKVTSNERPATQPSPIMVKSHTDDQDQRLMKLKKPNVNEKRIIETISDSILSMKPKILRSLYGWMQKRKQDNYFGIHADHGLFEEGMVQFWIDPNEIIRMIFMNNKWLDISSITWFTIMLNSRLLNQRGVSKSTFINPNMITETVCNEDPDRAISYVQKALIMHKEKVFFPAPYWQSGHWVLFIMWPPKNYGMILDSIKGGKTAASYKLTKVMQRAFTNNRIGAGSQIKWLMSNCNQQVHSWECGYYVMKWMFDFVMPKIQQFLNKTPVGTTSLHFLIISSKKLFVHGLQCLQVSIRMTCRESNCSFSFFWYLST